MEGNSAEVPGNVFTGANLIRTNNQVDGDPAMSGDRIDIPASCLRQDVMKPGEYVPPNVTEE